MKRASMKLFSPLCVVASLWALGCAPKSAVTNAPTSTAPTTANNAANNAPVAVTPAPSVRSVETFDAVWETVRTQHFDKTLNGVDWDAVRVELRPHAQAALTQDQARAVLMDMLSRLGQSHFAIIPSDAAERSPTLSTPEEQVAAPASTHVANETSSSANTSAAAVATSDVDTNPSSDPSITAATQSGPGVCGVDIALVDGEPTVLRVTPNLSGARAGVLVGWKLLAVDGALVSDELRPLREEIARESDHNATHARQLRVALAVTGNHLLSGDSGEVRRATFEDASGHEQVVSIAFEPAPLGSTQFGNLPPFSITVDSQIISLPVEGGKPVRIGVLGFNIWMTGASDAIDQAIDTMRSCDGIIIDLRGNPGGVGAMSMGLAGYFLATPASLGSMLGRDNTLEFKASPRKVSAAGKRVRTISKPLAIVMDARSASTSEVFAGGMQDLGRARVFGETSAGMALPATAIELPSGDVLLHAIADFVTCKGTRLEGRGVIPDEAVAPTRAALLVGRDGAIDAATVWICASTMSARASKAAATAAETVATPTSIPTTPDASPR